MSNVQEVRQKKVKVMLDKERTLYFDLNAFAELEEAYGSVDNAMKALDEGSIKGIRLLLWAGLIHEELDENGEPTITQKQVGSWLDLEKVTELSEKIGEALSGNTPQKAPVPLVQMSPKTPASSPTSPVTTTQQ